MRGKAGKQRARPRGSGLGALHLAAPGGRQIGGYDDNLLGRAVDLNSGELSDKGTILGTEHIGATILALADIEPEGDPIQAVLA